MPVNNFAKKELSNTGMAYFVWVVIITVCTIVFSVILNLYLPELFEYKWLSVVLSMIIMYVIGAPICYYILKKSDRTDIEKTNIKAGKWLVYFLISIFIMYAGNIIGLLFMTIISKINGMPMVNPLVELFENGNIYVTLFFTIIAAPVLEELMFRKLLIDRLIKYGQKFAIILSALLFGLFHGNLYQFFYAFGLGLVMGYIYSKYGKLRYTVLLHFVINLIGGLTGPLVIKASGLMDFYLSGSDNPMDIMQYISPKIFILVFYVFTLFVLAVTGLVLFVIKIRKIKFYKGEIEVKKEERIKTFIFNPGILLSVVAGIAMVIASAFSLPSLAEIIIDVLI